MTSHLCERFNFSRLLVLAFTISSTHLAFAETSNSEPQYWYVSGSASALYSSYDDSIERANMNSLGARVDLDYLEQFEFDFAYNYVALTYTNDAQLLQDEWFLNAKKHFYVDSLVGRVSLLAGFSYLENDQDDSLIYPGQDDSSFAYIYSGGIRYLNYGQNFTFTSLYSYSFYANFEAAQWFNKAGVGLGGHWLAVSNYYIESFDETTSAFEFSCLYNFDLPLLSSVYVSYLFGERLYAIEPEANVILNLADKQTGLIKLSATVPVSQSVSVELLGSYSQYEYLPFLTSQEITNTTYSQTSAYLNLKVKL